MKQIVICLIAFSVSSFANADANISKRLILDVGLGMGYSEDSKEREAISSIPLVSGSLELEFHTEANLRLIEGLYAVGGFAATWQEGDEEYDYTTNDGTKYTANDVDLDIQKRYCNIGAKYRFRHDKTFSPYIGGGLYYGTIALRQDGSELVRKLGTSSIPSEHPDKADMTGVYAEGGISFLWRQFAGLKLGLKAYEQKAGPYKTIDNKKITLKGITAQMSFIIAPI